MNKNKTTPQERGAARWKKGGRIKEKIVVAVYVFLTIVCFIACLLFDMNAPQRLGNTVALTASAFQFGWFLRASLD